MMGFYLLDAAIVIYIFYVCHFLVSSKNIRNDCRIRSHVYSNTANLVIASRRIYSHFYYTNRVFLKGVTIRDFIARLAIRHDSAIWRLAIRAIRDSDNPAPHW